MTERRSIAMVGRVVDLQRLHTWLNSPQPVAVRLLTGRAGSGKTRLAIELCEQAEMAGWAAGFAHHDPLRQFCKLHDPAEWQWQADTIIVIDYAAALAPLLRRCFEALARHSTALCDHKLRILLLERYAERDVGWWAELNAAWRTVRPRTRGSDGSSRAAALSAAE